MVSVLHHVSIFYIGVNSIIPHTFQELLNVSESYLPAFSAANCSGVTLIILGAFDVVWLPAGASFRVWVFSPVPDMPDVLRRTILVMVGLRFIAELVFANVEALLCEIPSANFPASVKAKVLEGSDTSPVGSNVEESSGRRVIPCAARSLTASSSKNKGE